MEVRRYPHFQYEKPFWATNTYVIGVDEVGRGCLAGPVHVGGVCFPLLSTSAQKEILELKIHDSKQCTEKKRSLLSPVIKEKALAWYVYSSSVEDINEKGIVPALESCVCTVIDHIYASLPTGSSIIVFTDTLPIKMLKQQGKHSQKAILKGDCVSVTVAAASIIAKVERDAYMTHLHEEFPHFNWNENKGYATRQHREAILAHGTSPHHRTLYLRKLLNTL